MKVDLYDYLLTNLNWIWTEYETDPCFYNPYSDEYLRVDAKDNWFFSANLDTWDQVDERETLSKLRVNGTMK